MTRKSHKLHWMNPYSGNETTLTLKQKGITLHIMSKGGKSVCGKSVGNDVDISFDLIEQNRSGHAYGKFLLKHAICNQCKKGARAEIQNLSWYTRGEKARMYESIFEPVPTVRPLPKKSTIGGVNKMMSNIRERLRRHSADWVAVGKPFAVKTPGNPKFVTWGESEHFAFLSGVNFAIQEVFKDFKLEKYDRFLDSVYRDLHEIVTGVELPSEKEERNDD